MPASAPGSADEDDERVEPGLEVHHHEEVDEHHGGDDPIGETAEARRLMLSTWPRTVMVVPRGEPCWRLGHDLVDGVGHRAEVDAFDVGLHVEVQAARCSG